MASRRSRVASPRFSVPSGRLDGVWDDDSQRRSAMGYIEEKIYTTDMIAYISVFGKVLI